jgi:hypothetical protein
VGNSHDHNWGFLVIVDIATAEPLLGPIGTVVGAIVGPFVAVVLRDRPSVKRALSWLVRLTRRLR